MAGGRRKARREAVFILYQADLLGIDVEASLRRAEREQPLDPYTRLLVTGVGRHLEAVDAMLARHLTGWTLGRLAPLERNILRVGAFELGWAEGVPAAVAMDEAVELAKRFASDEAAGLVNGVLAAVQREREEYTQAP